MSAGLIKSIQAKYNQGTAKRTEDGYVVREPFFMVADAFSEPNSQKYPQIIINGLTLGEITVRSIEKTFRDASSYISLNHLLFKANLAVAKIKIAAKIPAEIARLSGVTFATAKVGENTTYIVTAGDAFALIILKNGKTVMTKNQVHLHDTRMNAEIERYMKEITREMDIDLKACDEQELKKIRTEMWNRFCPILKEARGKDINNPDSPEGYGALNGDQGNEKMWQKLFFPTSKIDSILLFTDGFVDWKFLESIKPSQLEIFISEMHRRFGIEGIIGFTRSAEKTRASENYITHAEATTIALEF